MARKKEIKTTNETVKYIQSLIKHGFNEVQIRSLARSNIDEKFIMTDVLNDLIADTVYNYPNYELMQSIVNNKIVIDKDSKGDTAYIVDKKKGIVTSLYKARIAELFTKPDFASSTYVASFTYNPYKFDILYKEGIGWHFNQFEPAPWFEEYFYSSGKSAIPNVELPVIYEEFLKHLVDGDMDSYNYVLDWISNAIKCRNYTILTTIGSQGIGKGVLGDIMRLLVGDSNFSLTDNRLVQKDFNAQLGNKRIVYLDEILVKTSSEINKFKSLINSTIEIEKKGQDAITTENYASIYTSSNDMDAINLTREDRRFSIINLTDKKLKDYFKHNIGDLLIEENIEKLGYYLWNREVSEKKMLDVFISKRTEEIMAATLSTWADYVIDEYAVKYAGRTIPITDVAKDVKEALDSYNYSLGRSAFQKLQAKYPHVFEVVRPASKSGKARVYCLKFNEVQNG